MKFIILILSLFLFSVSSYSQNNTKSNVEFTSDSLEVDENKNLMIAMTQKEYREFARQFLEVV